MPTFEIERTAAPTPARHRCQLPTRRERGRLHLKTGAIVRCVECGARFEWKQSEVHFGELGPSARRYWDRLPDPQPQPAGS